MPQSIPRFRLSHGQVAWALSLGRPPEEKLLEQLRYLRQLGVPFADSELGVGRGKRLSYDFYQLVETGVALFALRRGVKPGNIASYLAGNRKSLRRLYREAYAALPEAAFEADWIKSRGRTVPRIDGERWMRLHDRFWETGRVDFLRSGEVEDLRETGDLVERYPGDEVMRLVPVTRIMLELVVWAKEAPETRPGPQ